MQPREKSSPAVAAAMGVLIAAAVALIALGAIDEPDLFWHLAVGRHIAAEHALPWANLWSFTAPTHSFYATSWLFGLGAFALHTLGGWAAIQIAMAAVGAAAFGIVLADAVRRGASAVVAGAVTLIAVFASAPRFTPRPHMVSYLCLAGVGALLHRARSRRDFKALLWAALVIAVWSNFHAGAVFGVAAVGLLAAAEVGDALRQRLRRSAAGGEELSGPPRPRPFVALGGFALAVAAFLANPSGLRLGSYALIHLVSIDEAIALQEFAAPPLSRYAGFYLILLVGAVCLVARWRRIDLFDLLLFAAFGIVAIRALRVVPKVLILATPILSVELTRVWRALQARWPSERARRALGAAAALAAFAAAPALCFRSPGELFERLHFGLDPVTVPEAATRWVRENGIQGNVFNGFDLGGWVEWALPESKVFQDARILAYPDGFFRALEAAEETPERFEQYVRASGAEWAFVSERRLRLSGYGLLDPATWALVYWDGVGRVFLRRDVERFAALVAREEYRSFVPVTGAPERLEQHSAADRETWASELARNARSTGSLASLLASCHALARQGALAEAAGHCATALERLDEQSRFHPEVRPFWTARLLQSLTVLAAQAGKSGQYAEAARTYAVALSLAPRDPGLLVGAGNASLHVAPADALRAFDDALAHAPEGAPAIAGALLGRGRALEALGRGDDARAAWDRLLKVAPASPEASWARSHLQPPAGGARAQP